MMKEQEFLNDLLEKYNSGEYRLFDLIDRLNHRIFLLDEQHSDELVNLVRKSVKTIPSGKSTLTDTKKSTAVVIETPEEKYQFGIRLVNE